MQNNIGTQSRGLRLLSLDGGGIRGFSELVILEEIMKRVQKTQRLSEEALPCKYFDMICGTSTGGLIAILLGRLRMSVAEAMAQYRQLAKTVFSERKATGKDGVFKKSKLEAAIKGVVEAKVGPGRGDTEGMLEHDDNGACKTFVCAVPALHLNRVPRLFRTYPVDRNEEDDCTIWEASRATSAAPYLFKRIQIGQEGAEEDFIDAGMGCNNPVKELVGEAEQVFGEDRDVACILSVGTGKPKVTGFKKPALGWQRILPVALIDALKQMVTDSEATAREMKQRYKNCPEVYYRLNADEGLEIIKLEDWESLGEVRTHTKTYLNKPDVSQEIDNIVASLVGTSSPRYTLRQLGSSLSAPENHQMFLYPQGISYFVARKVLFAEIETALHENEDTVDPAIIILLGMGGSGKTQLALEYCRRTQESKKYNAIFWVDASSPSSIARGFGEIEKTIFGTKRELADAEASIRNVTDAISRWRTSWLIIFDNFDQPRLFDGRNIRDYFPRGKRGAILFTTRNKLAGRLGHMIKVAEMSEDEGLRLLLRRCNKKDFNNEDMVIGGQILRRLGYLALAIDQAGAYISALDLQLDLFMDHFNNRRDKVLSKTPALWEYRRNLGDAESESSVSVFTTWEMSFEQIEGDDTVRKDKEHLLTVSAFFDNRDIFEDLFQTYFEGRTPAWMAIFSGDTGIWSTYEFGDVLAELKGLSLLEQEKSKVTALGTHFSLHPLIQDWLRLRTASEECCVCAIEAIKMLSAVLEARDVHQMTIQTKRTITSHMRASIENDAKYLNQKGLDSPDLKWATFNFAKFYHSQRLFRDAEKLYCRALKAWEMEFGLENPGALCIEGNLATIYSMQERRQEAEQLYLRVLDGMRKELGDDHIDTIHTLHNLALVYSKQGKFDDAERLCKQTLEIKEKRLGGSDPDTLRSVHNLALNYYFRRDYQSAELLFERVLRETQLGREHPVTLGTREFLAMVYDCQGRHEEAEQLLRQVLEAREQRLGAEYPETLDTVYRIAALCSSQGRITEAEELLKRAFEGRKRVLGDDNPLTVQTGRDLTSGQRLTNEWIQPKDVGKSSVAADENCLYG